MKYKIYDYSCYREEWKSLGSNYSDVITKLIYITAKVTERFASDIVIDIECMEKHTEAGESFDWLLLFYDCGVHRRDIEDNEFDWEPCNGMGIQHWRLTFDGETVVLKRVNIRRADGLW